jgi:hypothetical protein
MALNEETLRNDIRAELVTGLRREIERSLNTAREHALAGREMPSRPLEEEIAPIAGCIAASVARAVIGLLRTVDVKIPAGIPVVRVGSALETGDHPTVRGTLE